MRCHRKRGHHDRHSPSSLSAGSPQKRKKSHDKKGVQIIVSDSPKPQTEQNSGHRVGGQGKLHDHWHEQLAHEEATYGPKPRPATSAPQQKTDHDSRGSTKPAAASPVVAALPVTPTATPVVAERPAASGPRDLGSSAALLEQPPASAATAAVATTATVSAVPAAQPVKTVPAAVAAADAGFPSPTSDRPSPPVPVQVALTCVECEDQPAELICVGCGGEGFCRPCWGGQHRRGKRTLHKTQPLGGVMERAHQPVEPSLQFGGDGTGASSSAADEAGEPAAATTGA